MNYPYLEQPLEDDLDDFLVDIEERFTRGALSVTAYHIALGKALAYVEARFSCGLMSKGEAYAFIHCIEAAI